MWLERPRRALPAICLATFGLLIASLTRLPPPHGTDGTSNNEAPFTTASKNSFRSYHRSAEEAPPKISVLVPVCSADEWIFGFLGDIVNQTAFRESEVLLGIVGHQSSFVRDAIASYARRFPNIIAVPMYDLPLDQVWNKLIRFHARGTYLSNANVEDRKRRDSLERHMTFLDNHPSASFVCAGVRATTAPNANWQSGGEYSLLWQASNPFQLKVEHFFSYDEYGRITLEPNFHHNNLMWRAALHSRVGYFRNELSPVSDWEFWLRSVSVGEEFWLLNETLGVNYRNRQSHVQKAVQSAHSVEQLRITYDHMIPCRKLNILVLHERSLKMNEGGDRRLWSLVKWLDEEGHHLTFVFRTDRGDSQFVEWISQKHHQIVQDNFSLNSMAAKLEDLDTHFDMAILPTWYWWLEGGKYVPSIPEVAIPILRSKTPSTKLVVMTDDVHHIRKMRTWASQESQEKLSSVKLGEVFAYSSGDLLLTVSAGDAEVIRTFVGGNVSTIETIPFTEDIVAHSSTFDERKDLLFLGSGHNANVETVTTLLDVIFPAVLEKMPDVQLILVGSTEWIRMAAGRNNVVAAGTVNSVERFLSSCRLFVNPSNNVGSGISTKVFTAQAHGLPAVSTKYGTVGLCDNDNCPGIYIASDNLTFTDLVVQLYTSRALWEKASESGFQYAKTHISLESLKRKETIFKGLLRTLSRSNCDAADEALVDVGGAAKNLYHHRTTVAPVQI